MAQGAARTQQLSTGLVSRVAWGGPDELWGPAHLCSRSPTRGLPASGTCSSPENFLVPGAHAAKVHTQAPSVTISGQRPTGYLALGCSVHSPTIPSGARWWLPIVITYKLLYYLLPLRCHTSQANDYFLGSPIPPHPPQVTTGTHIFNPGRLLAGQKQRALSTSRGKEEGKRRKLVRMWAEPPYGEEEEAEERAQ